MAIEWKDNNDIIVLHLRDNLIGGLECSEVKEIVQDFIRQGRYNFVVDFSKLHWANSAGVGALISCYHNIRKQGGDLRFACPTPKVKFYLHISKLETVFSVYDNVDDAVASFKNESAIVR